MLLQFTYQLEQRRGAGVHEHVEATNIHSEAFWLLGQSYSEPMSTERFHGAALTLLTVCGGIDIR